MKMEESLYDWNLESRIENLDYIDTRKAEDYLLKKVKGINKKILKKFNNELETDILRACGDALNNDYTNKFQEWFLSEVQDYFNEKLPDYKMYFYSSEDNTYHKKFMYDTDEFILILNKVNAKEFFEDRNYYEDIKFSEIDKDLSEFIEINKLNTEFFDYYGTVGDCDNWLECFIGYNEVESIIEQYLEKKRQRVKSLIKSRVNLIYR